MESDVESQASISEPSQRFKPREDDDKTLYEVIEITAEKGDRYKVRWKGKDPKTRKPWAQSWVPKTDCTDDLVLTWKRKMKDKARTKAKKKGRDSTASKRTARTVSIASSSRITGRSNSTATNSTANGYVRRGREISKPVGPSQNDKPISRKFIKNEEQESEDDERQQGDGMLSLRPDSSFNRRSSSSTTTVKPQQSEVRLKGTKRKIAEVQSTNSSANNSSRRRGGTIDVEANDDERDLVEPHVVLSSRPKKKRKIVVEIMQKPQNSPEPSHSRGRGQGKKIPWSRTQQNRVRKNRGKEKGIGSNDEDIEEVDEGSAVDHKTKPVNEDENDEKMVGEVLSEGLASPATSARGNKRSIQDPNINVSDNEYDMVADGGRLENAQAHIGDIEEGPQVGQMVHKASKGKERVIETQEEDDDEIVILEDTHSSPPVTSAPRQGGFDSRPRKHTFPGMQPQRGKNKPLSTSNAKDKLPVASTSPFNPSPRTLSSVQRVEKKVKETLIPDVSVLQISDSNLYGREHDPNNELGTPAPLEGNLQTRSMEDRPSAYAGDKHVGNVAVEEIESNSRLSPGAKRRLEIFDVEVMGKQKRTSEESVPVSPTHRHSTSKSATNSNSKQLTPMIAAGLSVTNTGNSGPSVPQPNVYAYPGDIVPESEIENSQSQEREIQLPTTYITNPQPVFEAGTLLTPVTPPSSPSKLTLKSRMKPRTPGTSSRAVQHNHSGLQSNSNADHPSNKLLRPLPQLSPSTFHAHLQPPYSSLPDSIIEPSSSNDRQVQEAIEEFESPEKEHYGNKKVVVLDRRAGQWDTSAEENGGVRELDTSRPKGKESAEDSDFFRRGKKIAEEAEAKKRRDSTVSIANYGQEEITKKKQSLRDVAARAEARSRSLSYVTRSSAGDQQPDDEIAVADASTTVVPPASGPHTISQEQSSQAQPEDALLRGMEEAYVDLSSFLMEEDETHDGNDGASVAPQSRFLRLEEEESTQDLLEEMLQLQAQQRQMDVTDSKTSQDLGVLSRSKTNDVDTSPLGSAQKTNVQAHSPSMLHEDEDEAQQPRKPTTRSRSRSKTPSSNSVLQNSKTRGRKKVLKIPSTIPSRSGSAELAFEQNMPNGFENVVGSSTLPSASVAQISSLEIRLSDQQRENECLQQELHTMHEQLKQVVEQNASSHSERSKQLAEMQSLLAAEKSTWDAERSSLVAQIALLEISKIQAEKDVEFFREQYGHASAYVTNIREENKELEKQAKIAEEQARLGVGLVKATFELRIKTLEDDMKMWRRMAEFAMEKDSRTNDEVRRRAAEEPELRVLIARQQEDLKAAQMRMEELEADVDEKERVLFASIEELENWKKENARLHSELNEALIKLDRIGRAGIQDSQDDGHEFVYRCQWRMEGDKETCTEVFVTMHELEQHLLRVGHLPRQ